MIIIMKAKTKAAEEWFKQAEYDYQTASAMFDSGRYIYTVFMCHLSVEKILKGIYRRTGELKTWLIENF